MKGGEGSTLSYVMEGGRRSGGYMYCGDAEVSGRVHSRSGSEGPPGSRWFRTLVEDPHLRSAHGMICLSAISAECSARLAEMALA